MEYLEKAQNAIINEAEFQKSVENLLIHSKNKSRFKKNPTLISTGGIDSSDYTNKSLRRSKFSQKKFNQTVFQNSGAAGSHFSMCYFNECKIKNANFQECTFYGGSLQNNLKDSAVINSNFNDSLFTNSFEIKNCFFKHCVFHGTAFINCNIQNTDFYSSTLEDTLFSNTRLRNVTFSDLNIDYSVFENVQMQHVILPFSQVCYSFGLLSYIIYTTDKVFISSSDAQSGYISKESYLQLISDFLIYYIGTKDYFPVANIYLAFGKNDFAREAIKKGILGAIASYDFMKIKYFCKLIYSYPVFSYHERKSIYDLITSKITFSDSDARLQYNYSVYRDEINNYLLNNSKHNVLTSEIDITTNINYSDNIRLGNLLTILETTVEYTKSSKGEHSISIRHNSNIEIAIFLQDIYQALTVIIPSIYSILLGIEILKEKRIANKQSKRELEFEESLKALEIESKQIELERNKIARQKELIELQNQLTFTQHLDQETLRQNILDLDIDIEEIHHITYGNIPPDANENIIQFSNQ
uniref:Pentapeptide repeat-containing protein n=1 Tax=Eubacterium plexicaudatum ASF492 TaxID=1235802 RepID=N1ZWI5_9FIRM